MSWRPVNYLDKRNGKIVEYTLLGFNYDTPDGRKRHRQVVHEIDGRPIGKVGERARQDYVVRRRRELEEEAQGKEVQKQEQHERERQKQAEQKEAGESEVPTLAKFVDERWLPVHPVAAKNAEKTVDARKWQLGIIKEGLGDKHLDKIDDERIERFAAELVVKDSRRGKPYSEKSVKEVLALLKQVLTKAKRWKLIAEVPEFPKIVVPEQPFDYFSAEETEQLLNVLQDDEERLLVLFAVRTGARPGEQIALEGDDINWVKRTVEFNKQIPSGKKKVTPTKTKKIRSVPLTSDLYAALKRHRHLRSKLVFCRPDGSAWDVHAWHTILHRALRKAGLKKVTWYALRHSFGSQAVAAGVPLNVVQQWMGHSTITMTMRYVHAAKDTGHWIEKLAELPRESGLTAGLTAGLTGSG